MFIAFAVITLGLVMFAKGGRAEALGYIGAAGLFCEAALMALKAWLATKKLYTEEDLKEAEKQAYIKGSDDCYKVLTDTQED